MTTLKLSYFGSIMTRQGSLGKAVMLGKREAAGKEEGRTRDGLAPGRQPPAGV